MFSYKWLNDSNRVIFQGYLIWWQGQLINCFWLQKGCKIRFSDGSYIFFKRTKNKPQNTATQRGTLHLANCIFFLCIGSAVEIRIPKTNQTPVKINYLNFVNPCHFFRLLPTGHFNEKRVKFIKKVYISMLQFSKTHNEKLMPLQ